MNYGKSKKTTCNQIPVKRLQLPKETKWNHAINWTNSRKFRCGSKNRL